MKLALGLPKGSLENSTIELFKRAGIHIRKSDRSYYPSCDDPELDLIVMRPQEIPRYVEQGILDAGITGQDWIEENKAQVVEVTELNYSKAPGTNVDGYLQYQRILPLKSGRSRW